MTFGITRTNGWTKPEMFYGYQTKFFQVVPTQGNYATAWNVSGSNFELAVRTIANIATVVAVGTPTSAGFIVGVEGDTVYGRGDNTGYAADNTTATLATNIFTATGVTSTVVEVILSGVGVAAGTVSNWDNV